MHQTSMIGFLQRPKKVLADIISIVLRRSDRDLFAVLLETVAPIVLLGLIMVARNASVKGSRGSRMCYGGTGWYKVFLRGDG